MLILWGRFRSWLSSFVRISHDPSGWLHISVRQPSRPKRKLRNETMQLVSELRVYIGNQPNPVTERMKQVLAAGGPGRNWIVGDAFDIDLDNKSRNEMNQKFGGRVQYLVGEYKRLGMLPDRRSSNNLEEPNANDILHSFYRLPWAHEAANQLEALARQL